MTQKSKKILRMLGVSILSGLLAGLIFGYVYDQYLFICIIALSISLTIWMFRSLLIVFFIPKIESWPRKKKIFAETAAFFLASLLGFLIPLAVLSGVFHFGFFGEKIFVVTLILLLILYLMFAGLNYSFRFFQELKEKEIAEERLKTLAAEAELRALRSQIRPHFLFNTLHSISALVKDDPELSRKMIAQLSRLLRISLESHDKMLVPLKKELDFVHSYMDIEKIRWRDKMDFQENVDPKLLEVDFPVMVLQPLLENAVKHGIAHSRTGGHIRLIVERDGPKLACRVTNTTGRRTSQRNLHPTDNGTGLSNVRQRLKRLFGERCIFQAGYTEEKTFEVRFSIPVESSIS